MKHARYVGPMAVLVVVLVIGAVPAVVLGSMQEVQDERQASGACTTLTGETVYNGRFVGAVHDAEGQVVGRVHGRYVAYITEEGVKGRFSGGWTASGMRGTLSGMILDDGFRGRWVQSLTYTWTNEVKVEGDNETRDSWNSANDPDRYCEARRHYGITHGGYSTVNGSTTFRGVWSDLQSGLEYTIKGEVVKDDRVRGRFKGEWVKVDMEGNKVSSGSLFGGYSMRACFRDKGHFKGIWTLGDEEKGSIRGAFKGGEFRGVWTYRNHQLGGWIKGTYADGGFKGYWMYRDGTPGGYLTGVYGSTGDDTLTGLRVLPGEAAEASP